MEDREYLRSLGYEVGERGRFSKEMIAALSLRNGVEESLNKEAMVHRHGFDQSVIRDPIRQPEELIGLDIYGNKVAFVLCAACTQHMMWCTCEDGVLAPSYIVSSKNPLVRLAS